MSAELELTDADLDHALEVLELEADWTQLKSTDITVYLGVGFSALEYMSMTERFQREFSHLVLLNPVISTINVSGHRTNSLRLEAKASFHADLMRQIQRNLARCDIYLGAWNTNPDLMCQLGFELGQLAERTDCYVMLRESAGMPIPLWINALIHESYTDWNDVQAAISGWLSPSPLRINLMGHYLKEVRKQLKLSQPELAEMMGLSPVMVNQVELGRRSLSRKALQRLGEVLSLHPIDSAYLMQIGGYAAKPLERKEVRLRDK